jgi:hypothetical protein
MELHEIINRIDVLEEIIDQKNPNIIINYIQTLSQKI